MTGLLDSVWSIVQRRTDTAYLFVCSLLTLATVYGKLFLPNVLSPSQNIGSSESPTIRSFTAASEFLSGGQWSWVQDTSRWLTERSEVLHTPVVLMLVGAGAVVGFQGNGSLRTKASATLLLSWVLMVNTGGMSWGNWFALIAFFLLGSVRHAGSDWGKEVSAAFIGMVFAPFYAVLSVVVWLIGRTRSVTSND